MASFLAEASARGVIVEIVGGRSKAEFGRSRHAEAVISTHVLRGIRDYDPVNRVITVQAGCSIVDIERELAQRGQMLAFEPVDMAAVYGGTAGRTTIGGVVNSNLAGSRRIVAGGVADNLLGLRGVSGRGDVFRSGGAVARGVDGFDLKRVLTGSWGTLAAIAEVSLRTAWLPEESRSVVFVGLTEEIAIKAMSDAVATPFKVTGTVHFEPGMAQRLDIEGLPNDGQSLTVLRLEASRAGMRGSVARLGEVLQPYGTMHELDERPSEALWCDVRHLNVMAPYGAASRSPAPARDLGPGPASTHGATLSPPLWRIVTRPSRAFEVVSSIRRYMAVDAVYDWAGGLIWLEVPQSADAGATEIRRVIASTGGHATLVRSSGDVKADVDVYEPMRSGVDFMTRRLKQVFDPAGILGANRLYAHV